MGVHDFGLLYGPFGAMTLVQSDNYPVAAHVIKDLFQLSPQAVAPTLISFAPGNVMLHLPAKANKESEAKKGIVKLMLFHIHGDINIKATLVSNIILAAPSKGMQVVLNQPCAAWRHQYQGNIGIKYHSSRSIKRDAGGSESALCSSSQSICRSHANDIRVGQATRLHQYPINSDINSGHVEDPASHMLQGNFATKKVTSLKIEANSVKPSTFLPQSNKFLVKQELLSKVKATSENVMDFADSQHKTKGKTAIARIGTMHSMVDFSSLCINIYTIITAICSNDEPQPILHQILLNFVAKVNNPDWVHWLDNVGLMPLLHWYCYSFLE
jgi:hypothetical protein